MTSYTPAPLRNASTVILARKNQNGFEIYLLQRSIKSGFMGGLYVFPGGVADPDDFDTDFWTSRIDLSPEQIEQKLGGPSFSWEQALGFSIAAIRETLEESAVFLAQDTEKRRTELEEIRSFRLCPDLPRSWFKTWVAQKNWVLCPGHLKRWSHWITPESMKKRFDTRFFMAFMPPGQTCTTDNRETVNGIWISPSKALEQNLTSETPLSPPTIVTMTQLNRFDTFDELRSACTARTWAGPITPRLVRTHKGPVIIEPWDPMWDKESIIDAENLASRVLAPGSDFSKIWCDNGIWKPVR